MFHELSKREKKIARVCIDKGLDAQFRESLEKFDSVITNWRNGKFEANKEAYHELYRTVMEQNKAIARRYDDLTGSRYLNTVAEIYVDGYINDDDIKDFSEEVRLWMVRVKEMRRSEKD
ncbi:MAG: hypothetical protein DI535_26165 [Citrobacter freundii]|nr:MAG: hypothetical protein DI535_26165 [Citrobacter freundii]